MSISHDEILFYVPFHITPVWSAQAGIRGTRREMLFMMSNMDDLSGQVVKIFSTFLVFPFAIPLHFDAITHRPRRMPDHKTSSAN
jgi:hypothetical protein